MKNKFPHLLLLTALHTVFILAYSQCPPGIMSHWTFDGDAHFMTNDEIGSNHGMGGMYPEDSPPGVVEFSRVFNGTSSMPQYYNNYPNYDWDQNLSVALWCRYSAEPDDFIVIIGYDEPNRTHWWVGFDQITGYPVFYLYDELRHGGAVKADFAINDSQWHFLVGTYNHNERSHRLYIDGQLVADSTRSYGSPFTANEAMQMGGMYINGETRYRYAGLIDEAALFDVALTEDQIADMYQRGLHHISYCSDTVLAPSIISEPVREGAQNGLYSYKVQSYAIPEATYALQTAPPGMSIDSVTGLIEWVPDTSGWFQVTVVARNEGGEAPQTYSLYIENVCMPHSTSYFDFDAYIGTSISDAFTHLSGGVFNGPTQTGSLTGLGLSFNGSNQYISLPNQGHYDWDDTTSMTIEFWCKPDAANTNLQVIIGRDQAEGTHWWIGLAEDTQYPCFYLYDENRGGTFLVGDRTIHNGQWHHVGVVYNRSNNKVELFIDGESNTETFWNYGAGFGADSEVRIANMYIHGENRFHYQGMLDELAIYDRALEAGDIQHHYNLGRAGFPYCYHPYTLPPPPIVDNPDFQHSPIALKYKLYPNPAQDKLHINFPQAVAGTMEIQLFNTLGELVLEHQLSGRAEYTLNTSELAGGLHLIQFKTHDGVILQDRVLIRE